MFSTDKLRAMNLSAVADELEELRAKVAALECEAPVACLAQRRVEVVRPEGLTKETAEDGQSEMRERRS